MIGTDNIVEIQVEDTTYLKELYKFDGGVVAYVVVISQYGTPETETLVQISNNGEIVALQKLLWKTSDAMYGYEPPTDEVVDPFYNRLVGFSAEELTALLSRVESGEDILVTNATNTSSSLVTAILEAFSVAENYLEPDFTARVVGIVIFALSFASAIVVIIIKRRKRA